jgi:hypothetical protein
MGRRREVCVGEQGGKELMLGVFSEHDYSVFICSFQESGKIDSNLE